MKRLIAALLLSAGLLPAATVDNVAVCQRGPWSQKVDITYNLTTDKPQQIDVAVYQGDVRVPMPDAAFSGDRHNVASGARHIVFDPSLTPYTNRVMTALRFEVTAREMPLYVVFDLSKTRPTAVWAWGSHLSDLISDNGAKMREMKDKGYDHILMNYAGFHNKNYRQQAIKFIQIADEIGLSVHVWLQCFYDGGWVSPIDDEKKAYKEEVYERIRNEATDYLEQWGVKGVHLDYIRFGGTASKHNWGVGENAVNSVNAVNRCCREIREICDGFDEGLVTSAALMPEPNSSSAYGQKPAEMAKYIHILMPMIYRYGSYNFSDKSFKERSDYYAEQAKIGGGVSWSGIQTYDAATHGMTAEAMRKDIDLMAETKASGIVLFRYQLGTFPDVKDIDWNKKSE